MKRFILMLAAGLTICSFNLGCVAELNRELMNMRQQMVANESLYAAATLAFASGADQMAQQKFIYQQKSLIADTDGWIREHTDPNGVVTASPDEMREMFGERDAKQAVYVEAQKTWVVTIENFRQMVADKQRLTAMVYAKEEDAQAAKDAQLAALDSLKKTLLGALPTAAVALPLLAP